MSTSPLVHEKFDRRSFHFRRYAGFRDSKRRRNVLIASTIIGVIILGTIVGGVVGALSAKSKSNSALPAPSTPSPTPGVSPGKSGCNATSAWQLDSSNHVNVTMGDRSFYVHVPAAYDSNKQHPVVLSYHGYSQNETYQELITGFSESGRLINNVGIVAVYPAGAWGPGKPSDGPTRAWQGAPYAVSGIDDISFTRSMVQALQENLCIDSSRLFASGKSNGGGFVNLLACTSITAAIFAAFAPVSAALYPSTEAMEGCDPGRVVPLVNLHGTADTIMPFHGSDQFGQSDYGTPDIQTWRENWASRNGCSNPARNFTIQNAVFKNTNMEQWECPTNNAQAQVLGYDVGGLGHSWPNTLGYDNGVAGFNATTDVIIPFFDAHSI